MSYGTETFVPQEGTFAGKASADARGQFIVKTYMHLLGAIVAFIMLEAVLLTLPIGEAITATLMSNRMNGIIMLGAFMGVSYIANRWAESEVSQSMQYLGLVVYVFAWSIMMLPILYIATTFGGDGVIPSAAIATLGIFTGLTAIVFITRKNFSFMGPLLGVIGFGAMGLIVSSILFGFSLGILFTYAMIVFAAGYVLYDTSKVLHDYRIGQHVAASLALFASIALLFWYILQLVMHRD
jgi:FtsH-binding integral membrane protein